LVFLHNVFILRHFRRSDDINGALGAGLGAGAAAGAFFQIPDKLIAPESPRDI
jgi:hypothetical protein